MQTYKVNEQIKSEKVVLILENGENHGEISVREAMYLAAESGFDLIQVSEPKGQLPICKLGDYGKMMYKQSKKEHKQHKNLAVKEVRVGYNIGEHDLAVKSAQVEKFINGGHEVKYSLRVKGRQKYTTSKTVLAERALELTEAFCDIATIGKPVMMRDGVCIMLHPVKAGRKEKVDVEKSGQDKRKRTR